MCGVRQWSSKADSSKVLQKVFMCMRPRQAKSFEAFGPAHVVVLSGPSSPDTTTIHRHMPILYILIESMRLGSEWFTKARRYTGSSPHDCEFERQIRRAARCQESSRGFVTQNG